MLASPSAPPLESGAIRKKGTAELITLVLPSVVKLAFCALSEENAKQKNSMQPIIGRLYLFNFKSFLLHKIIKKFGIILKENGINVFLV